MTSKASSSTQNPSIEPQEVTFKRWMQDTKKLFQSGVSRRTQDRWFTDARAFKDPQFIASLETFVDFCDELTLRLKK